MKSRLNQIFDRYYILYLGVFILVHYILATLLSILVFLDLSPLISVIPSVAEIHL